MYCKHCGKEVDSNYVFCWNCGKRVNAISGVVFNNSWHKDVINAYTVLETCKSGAYLIGDLGVGFVILNENSKKLVVDTLFEDVITHGRYYVDTILVKKNGKWGLLNPLTGIAVCDFIYDDICRLEEDYEDYKGDIIVYSNDLCGKIDCDGNIILPIIYDEIRSHGRVKYQGLWGCVKDGKQIIPCDYIKLGGGADWCENGHYFCPSQYKNGKWGVIDYNGKIFLNFEYDEIRDLDDFYCEMRKGDKWGCLNYSELTPCEYSLKEIKMKRYSD